MSKKDYELDALLRMHAELFYPKGRASTQYFILNEALSREEAQVTSSGDAIAFIKEVQRTATEILNEVESRIMFDVAV